MTASAIDKHIASLLQLSPPSPEALGKALTMTFDQREDHGHLSHLKSSAPASPYVRAEVKINRKKGETLLILDCSLDDHILESQLNPPATVLPRMSVNPRFPPEGLITQTYALGDVDVAYHVTKETKRLRQLTITWFEGGRPASPAGPPGL